jgi:hypothetical protein
MGRAAPPILVLLLIARVVADDPAVAAKMLPAEGHCRCSANDADGGHDRAGSDIKAINAASAHVTAFTADECCIECNLTPDCEFYQVSTEASGSTVCWLKSSKGPITGEKDTVSASLAPVFKSDPGYCHAYPTTFGGRFLSFMGVCALAYLIGGALYGQRIQRLQQGSVPRLLEAHPHAHRWVELKGLVQDGMAFARGGGRHGGQRAPADLEQPMGDGGGGAHGRAGTASARSKASSSSSGKHRSSRKASSGGRSKKSKRSGGSGAAAEPLLTAGGGGGSGGNKSGPTAAAATTNQTQGPALREEEEVDAHLHQSQARIKVVGLSAMTS